MPTTTGNSNYNWYAEIAARKSKLEKEVEIYKQENADLHSQLKESRKAIENWHSMVEAMEKDLAAEKHKSRGLSEELHKHRKVHKSTVNKLEEELEMLDSCCKPMSRKEFDYERLVDGIMNDLPDYEEVLGFTLYEINNMPGTDFCIEAVKRLSQMVDNPDSTNKDLAEKLERQKKYTRDQVEANSKLQKQIAELKKQVNNMKYFMGDIEDWERRYGGSLLDTFYEEYEC